MERDVTMRIHGGKAESHHFTNGIVHSRVFCRRHQTTDGGALCSVDFFSIIFRRCTKVNTLSYRYVRIWSNLWLVSYGKVHMLLRKNVLCSGNKLPLESRHSIVNVTLDVKKTSTIAPEV
jgi:hypothetical protein